VECQVHPSTRINTHLSREEDHVVHLEGTKDYGTLFTSGNRGPEDYRGIED